MKPTKSQQREQEHDRVVADVIDQTGEDPVSNVLKWILLAVAIATFGLLGWTTVLTYETAPPFPDRFVTTGGTVLMSADDIYAGKAGFQKADLMDYGSLYGMGSYFGEDYTAQNLVRLATLTEDNIAKAEHKRTLADLAPEQQAGVKVTMQAELQGVDLTKQVAVIPDALAGAITVLQGRITDELLRHDFAKGWTKAYALDEQSARQTAAFLIYSSLTTVARRPGTEASWTQNWPFEPLVGNTPTTSTFQWTWISFCFTFFAFGAVLFIYERYLNDPDNAPMDPVLASFRPLTASQRRVGKYFLVVAAVLLLQILVGSIMAHYYTDRTSFYGIKIDSFLPFNFLRDVHIQTPIVWIGLSWIGAALFLAPAISGREAKGQAFLVDLLFWVTLSSSLAPSSAIISASWATSAKDGSGSAIRACPISSSAGSGRSGSLPGLSSGALWSSARSGRPATRYGRQRASSGPVVSGSNI